jgi:hypothetical protein
MKCSAGRIRSVHANEQRLVLYTAILGAALFLTRFIRGAEYPASLTARQTYRIRRKSHMTIATTSVLATACLLASSLSHANCSPTFTERFSSAQRMVDSLRPDKPAQVRVAAFDGSEYTAGQAQWMKGQLRSALQSCTHSDEASAAATLQGVTDLLNSRHRSP